MGRGVRTPVGQLGLAIDVTPPAPGARRVAQWEEGNPPGWGLYPDDRDAAADAVWRLEVGEDVWVETVAESGCAWWDPPPSFRAEAVMGRAAAAADSMARWYRLNLPEANEARAESFARAFWQRRRVIGDFAGVEAGLGWRYAGLSPWLPVERDVETLIFAEGDEWWSSDGGYVWVDEEGALRGIWFGYPSRPVVTVAVGQAL